MVLIGTRIVIAVVMSTAIWLIVSFSFFFPTQRYISIYLRGGVLSTTIGMILRSIYILIMLFSIAICTFWHSHYCGPSSGTLYCFKPANCSSTIISNQMMFARHFAFNYWHTTENLIEITSTTYDGFLLNF